MRTSHLYKLLCHLKLNILDFVLLIVCQLSLDHLYHKLEYQLHLLLLFDFHQMVYVKLSLIHI